jgi:dienelactone hydrolase
VIALFAGGCGSGASSLALHPSGTLPVESGLATTVDTQTFVDTHHTTAADGPFPELPSRTLVTTIVSPTGQGGPFPLVVFSHGFTATPADYLPLLRQWAAAGYVVAAPAFPLTNGHAPGGPTQNDVVNQPSDVSFVITSVLALNNDPTSPLHGLVDGTRIGVAGHSAGAATTLGVALDTCCRDIRIQAAVILSGGAVTFPFGAYPAPDPTPILFLHGTDDKSIAFGSGLAAYHDAHPPKFFVTLNGSGHTDPYLGNSTKADEVVTTATIDFFDRYLKDSPVALQRLQRDANVAGTADLQDTQT